MIASRSDSGYTFLHNGGSNDSSLQCLLPCGHSMQCTQDTTVAYCEHCHLISHSLPQIANDHKRGCQLHNHNNFSHLCLNCENLLCRQCCNNHNPNHHFISMKNLLLKIANKYSNCSHNDRMLADITSNYSNKTQTRAHDKQHTNDRLLNKMKVLEYQIYEITAKNNEFQHHLATITTNYTANVQVAIQMLTDSVAHMRQILNYYQGQFADVIRRNLKSVNEQLGFTKYLQTITRGYGKSQQEAIRVISKSAKQWQIYKQRLLKQCYNKDSDTELSRLYAQITDSSKIPNTLDTLDSILSKLHTQIISPYTTKVKQQLGYNLGLQNVQTEIQTNNHLISKSSRIGASRLTLKSQHYASKQSDQNKNIQLGRSLHNDPLLCSQRMNQMSHSMFIVEQPPNILKTDAVMPQTLRNIKKLSQSQNLSASSLTSRSLVRSVVGGQDISRSRRQASSKGDLRQRKNLMKDIAQQLKSLSWNKKSKEPIMVIPYLLYGGQTQNNTLMEIYFPTCQPSTAQHKQSSWFDQSIVLQHTDFGIFSIKDSPQHMQGIVVGGRINQSTISDCIFMLSYSGRKRQLIGHLMRPCANFGYSFIPEVEGEVNGEENLIESVRERVLGYLYLCGGVGESGQSQSQLSVYAVLSKSDGSNFFKGEQLRNMDCPRHSLTLTYYHGCLYAIGGTSATKQALPTVERYILNEQRWQRCGNLNQPRTYHSSIALKSGLYVLGGWNGQNSIRAIQKYDEAKNKFKVIMELPEGRIGMSIGYCTTSEKSIVVMGGHNEFHDLDSCLEVKVEERSFVQLPLLGDCRAYAGACPLYSQRIPVKSPSKKQNIKKQITLKNHHKKTIKTSIVTRKI